MEKTPKDSPAPCTSNYGTSPSNMTDTKILVLEFLFKAPSKLIIVGKMGEPERIITSLHILPDLTLMTVGTKKGTILVYQSKNLL